jgi:pimeloyl-ACP methyl ester carboxylesterase
VSRTTAPDPPADSPAFRRRPAEHTPAAGELVLVHGTLDDGHGFRRVQDELPRWTTTTYDRRGWGRSMHPASLGEDVADLQRLLQRGSGPIGLVGHSFGATIACTVAAAMPDHVSWVVAYEPPLPWLPWWPDLAPWEELVLGDDLDPAGAAERLLRAVLGDDGWDGLPARVQQQRRDASSVLVAEMRALRDSPPGFDPLVVRPPVLVGAGEHSLEHHRVVSARLAELLPRGHYVELPGAEHSAHVSHPTQFAELIAVAASL